MSAQPKSMRISAENHDTAKKTWACQCRRALRIALNRILQRIPNGNRDSSGMSGSRHKNDSRLRLIRGVQAIPAFYRARPKPPEDGAFEWGQNFLKLPDMIGQGSLHRGLYR